MPATNYALIGHDATCHADADHFIARRESTLVTRIRARYDGLD